MSWPKDHDVQEEQVRSSLGVRLFFLITWDQLNQRLRAERRNSRIGDRCRLLRKEMTRAVDLGLRPVFKVHQPL